MKYYRIIGLVRAILRQRLKMTDSMLYALVVVKTLNVVLPTRCFAEYRKEMQHDYFFFYFKSRGTGGGALNYQTVCYGPFQIVISRVPLTLQLTFFAKCVLFNISLSGWILIHIS